MTGSKKLFSQGFLHFCQVRPMHSFPAQISINHRLNLKGNYDTWALWSLFSCSRLACWATVFSCFLLSFSECSWDRKRGTFHKMYTWKKPKNKPSTRGNNWNVPCLTQQECTNLLTGYQVFIFIITWGGLLQILLTGCWICKSEKLKSEDN